MGTVTPRANMSELRPDVTAEVRRAYEQLGFGRDGMPAMSEATLIAAHGGLPRRCPCHGTDELEHRQRVLAAATIRAERAAAAAERTA